MTTLHFRGPVPPAGAPLGFCTVCVMLYKAEATNGPLKEQIEAATRDGSDQAAWIALNGRGVPHAAEPQEAVAWGIYPALGPPQLGGTGVLPLPVPLCWSHLLGLTLQQHGVLPAGPMDMAAMKGVPLLGQKR